jgi:hypothetical protein
VLEKDRDGGGAVGGQVGGWAGGGGRGDSRAGQYGIWHMAYGILAYDTEKREISYPKASLHMPPIYTYTGIEYYHADVQMESISTIHIYIYTHIHIYIYSYPKASLHMPPKCQKVITLLDPHMAHIVNRTRRTRI